MFTLVMKVTETIILDRDSLHVAANVVPESGVSSVVYPITKAYILLTFIYLSLFVMVPKNGAR